DQLFLTYLRGPKYERRFLNLYNSTVIFDEIQMYDPAIFGVFLHYLQYGVPNLKQHVLVMSATIPNYFIDLITERCPNITLLNDTVENSNEYPIKVKTRYIGLN